MAVLADQKIYSDEIQALTIAALSLKEKGVFKEPMSGADILSWFEVNKKLLRAKMKTPDFEAWLYACLDGLDRVPHKTAILEALTEIALADREFHFSEKALLILTSRHWNLSVN